MTSASVTAQSIPIIPVAADHYTAWYKSQQKSRRRWLKSIGFSAQPGTHCLVPDTRHKLGAVVVACDGRPGLWTLAELPSILPEGDYHIDAQWTVEEIERAGLGWMLGCYRFEKYKENNPVSARLVLPQDCDRAAVCRQAEAIWLIRDLINTPAEDMMPEQLAEAVKTLGKRFKARVKQIIGDELLAKNYPMIHLVGRASAQPPRLIDLRWGNRAHPKVTLVGKGVCFDSGGLDIKSASNMRLMKKDMGGAAHVIGLAQLIMSAQLPVRLRLLVAGVENAISANAFRPGDIVRARNGTSIEIDNTDAEGRLILCDALSEAAAESPDIIIDFATLTGAARVAVGTDIAAFFSNKDEVAGDLIAVADKHEDPLWRLPLHQPYRRMLNTPFADIVNSASSGYGGAITAALFLQEFVPRELAWLHFDLMAWNLRSQPGRPEGGEAMGLRAVFHYLSERFKDSPQQSR